MGLPYIQLPHATPQVNPPHSYSGNLLYKLSDHLTQFLILGGFVTERSLPETLLSKKDYEHFNIREFEELVINGLNEIER